MATSARQWKNKVATEGADLDLPSGNTALVRQVSPQAFITSGLIPDPLTAIIRKAIHNKQGLPPKELEKITEDPDQLASALEMFDRVLEYVVIDPPVEMPPPCHINGPDGEPCGLYANTAVHKETWREGHHRYVEGPRDPEVLYADMVDMEDKQFIFQWVLGGTRDLTRFREEQQAVMESVSNGKAVQGKAKRSSGRR